MTITTINGRSGQAPRGSAQVVVRSGKPVCSLDGGRLSS